MAKTELEIANEVIEGKWGTGKDRENRIWKAGYDFNQVQAYVNRIIQTGLPIKEITIDSNECSGLVVYVKCKR